jgi:sugar (pentulose or hexulose) kinase
LDDGASGVYSHRHPDGWWLPGGASNTGAGSLSSRFPDADLADLDERAAQRGPSTVACYPAPGRGERFPFAVGDAEEVWTGTPEDEVDRYRAVLEGVAFVERLAYDRLRQLGASVDPPLRSAGGGSASGVWTAIRATVLGMPVVSTPSAGTAFGACVLAAAGTVHPDLAAAADAMVGSPGPPVEPVDRERGRLEESYGRFRGALEEKGWLPWPA